MLIVGVLYRNLPFIHFGDDISTHSASTLRDVSLAVILLKAGLGLDAQKLKVLRKVVFRLSFVPCILEALTSTVASRFLLGLPWLWACMLGFILSAVSAAVLVPGALSLEESRQGTAQGVPTLLMASVSLDNITALTGFVVIFNVLTSTENVAWTFCKRLLEPFVGLLVGATCGIFLWYFPNEENSDRPTVVYYRTALLCLGGLAFTFVSKKFRVSGVGALGCVSLAFFASLRWRNDADSFAAVGSQTLDFGETEGKSEQFRKYGNQVLTLSALSIVLMAPLGAALMDVLGHRLLKKEVIHEERPGVEHHRKTSVPAIQISTHYGSCSTRMPEDTPSDRPNA